MRTSHALTLAATTLLASAAAASAGPGDLYTCEGRLHDALPGFDRRSATGHIPGDPSNCTSMASDSLNNATPYCTFHVEFDGEANAQIRLESLEPNPIDLDPHVAVYCAPFDPQNPTQNLITLDDDSFGYPNASIALSNLNSGDELVIVVSSYAAFNRRQFGAFRLSIIGLAFSDPCECSPTDLNRDGLTNSIDLTILLADLGRSGKGLAGDINNSGNVDDTDLNLLLDDFGAPCPVPVAIEPPDPDPTPRPTADDEPAIGPRTPIKRIRRLDDR